jgi:iron complex outermembrane receptor protein
MKLKPLVAVILSTTLALPAIAIAQSRGVLEEVIVTAQKREETLQDVPIAISALSADTLEKQGIHTVSDLQLGQVPSLRVIPFAGYAGAMQFGIRGVSEQNPTDFALERPVAVYVDGAYIARGNGIDTEIFDTERMEVLRGPQGTLFGRNAQGGAVNIVTKKPSGQFGLRQELEATTLDQYRAKTVINTPQLAGWAANLTLLKRYHKGIVGNPDGNHDFDWQDKFGYRLALSYEPSDNFVAHYAYDHSETEYMNGYSAMFHKPAISWNPRPIDRHNPGSSWHGSDQDDAVLQTSGHNLTLEWDITDELTFKSISTYRRLKTDHSTAPLLGSDTFAPGTAFGDTADVAYSSFAGDYKSDQDQQAQEFQLIGDAGRLQWQVGVMYFHEDGTQWDYGRRPQYRFSGCTPLVYGDTCTGFQFIPWNPNYASLRKISADTDSYGIYGQATWNPPILDDRLELTLGARYSKDYKSIERAAGTVVDTADANAERADPAVTVSYRLLPDTSVYARYATAYRGGGVGTGQSGSFEPFTEEEVKSSELGLKSTFWDSRARINAAAFYNEVKDRQQSVQQNQVMDCPTCTVSNTIVLNADGITRYTGFEFDTSVVVLDGLTLSLAYTYLDTSTSSVAIQGGGTLETVVAAAPRNSWAVSIDYEFEPFTFGILNAHIDVTDSDEYCFNASCDEDPALDRIAAKGGDNNTLVNARLTLSEIPVGVGSMRAALWGKNLTDRDYIAFAFPVPGASSFTSNYTGGIFGEPRSVGVTLTYEY